MARYRVKESFDAGREKFTEGQEVAFSTTVQSRWAQSGGPQGPGGQRGGRSFDRGVQMMGYRMSGAGAGGRSGGGGGARGGGR